MTNYFQKALDNIEKTEYKQSDNFAFTANINKIDEDERLVFGIFSVSKIGDELVIDREQDRIDPVELEKGAYNHVLHARIAGENHIRKGVGSLVESMVFTPEKISSLKKALEENGIPSTIDIPAVFWWGGYHISDDDTWNSIKKGDFVSFSIGGSGTRTKAKE